MLGSVLESVQDVERLVQADGIRLAIDHLDADAGLLRLRLDLSNVDCLDCVLPPAVLTAVLTEQLTHRVPGLEILIVDPRSEDAPPSAGGC